ncbi:hypothetical protein D3C76_1334340 [compost metagenome]
MSLRHKLEDLVWKTKRYIVTIKVDVYPTHPGFPSHTSVTGILLNFYKVPLDSFMTPMTDKRDVDLGYIIENVPFFHKLHVHYGEDFRGLHTKLYKEVIVR